MTTAPPDPSCIFCKIVAGQIPCHKLYEDAASLVFLDIAPLSHGHCLLVPKPHYPTLDQLPTELAVACLCLLPRLSKALTLATGAKAWNILQNNGKTAGQAVDHVHFHLIPRSEGDGLGFRWPAGKLDPADAQKLLSAIKSKL